MSKLRIVAENYADSSILESTPTMVPTLDNLKAQSRAKIVRSALTLIPDLYSPTYNQEIGIQLPSLKTISAIVLGRHNFGVGMGIKFICYDAIDYDDTTGVELYNSGDLLVTSEEAENDRIPWGHFLWGGGLPWGGEADVEEFAPKSNYVHWVGGDTVIGDELTETLTGAILFDTGTSDPLVDTGGILTIPAFVGMDAVQSMKIYFKIADGLQIEIGRLIVGDYIQPQYNMDYGHKLEWKEDSQQYRTEAATLRSDISLPIREMQFALNTIHKDDRTDLMQNFRYVGLRKDFYINLFPDSSSEGKERDYSGIMKLTKVPVMSEYAPEIYKSNYVMEEV